MAGEWIAYDLSLPAKPEVQELMDETGLPVEVVVYRLLQLWGWASMHCTDGTARMTLPRLVRTCGGDEAFWLASTRRPLPLLSQDGIAGLARRPRVEPSTATGRQTRGTNAGAQGRPALKRRHRLRRRAAEERI
jgi:hypothetical protein